MSAAETILVGRGSVLAREFAARHPETVLRALGHADALDAASFDGARCVVNFAFAPALETSDYDAALDIDRRIAALAARLGLHYVMISSRRVYAAGAQWLAREDAPTPGTDAYGRNKARIERELRALLGGRLTILRPGNVIGYEPDAGRRRFGAYLQHQLLSEGRIRLTIPPSARKDLVPAGYFCRVLREAVRRRAADTFNVGAGYATSAGDAARWLLEGFGRGALEVGAAQPADEFLLDSARLQASFGLACPADAVKQALLEIGRRLARPAASD